MKVIFFNALATNYHKAAKCKRYWKFVLQIQFYLVLLSNGIAALS